MGISPLAGKPAPKEMLVDVGRLEREHYDRKPDVGDPNQLVHFGTSGHRGSPLRGTFTEAHILAISQAICDYRRAQGIDGPLYVGKDTHALSGPAQRTAVEVLAGNGVETTIQRDDGVTPTPVVSRAILVYNRDRKRHCADGIVVTPEGAWPEEGRAFDRRSALLRLSRLERRVGQPRAVPHGRASPTARRRRRAARLLQCPGPALGEPDR